MTQPPTQPQILRTYTALQHLRPDWAGALILQIGLPSEGAALSIAANIAGAVSLAIDNNPEHLREVVRTGAADFVVNTLDEAIRAMKNELRKGAPLSVALDSDPASALEEIIERGLAPQLFSVFNPVSLDIGQRALQFQQLGADLIDFADAVPSIPPAHGQSSFRDSHSLLDPILWERSWQLITRTFETPTELRAFDSHALEALSAGDTLRRRWLQSAPRILQRQRPPQRSLWLTKEEAKALSPE